MNELAIFSKLAPPYWAKGLPVIPLHHYNALTKEGKKKGKAPFFDDWSRFQSTMPTADEQAKWLAMYENNNIGLPLGPQSGLAMIDIDTNDVAIQKAVFAVLPPPVWIRIGAKGMMLAYKYNNTPSSKIHQKDNGKPLVEILSAGNQIVLPGSIHPDTLKPYEANKNLYDILDEIPMMPADIDSLLRTSMSQVVELEVKGGRKGSKFNASKAVPEGQRDVNMVKAAGSLCRAIFKNELSLLDAVADMRVWFDLRVEKTSQDNIDVNKGINKIVEFVQRGVEEGRILPSGWDRDMDDEMKKAMGVTFTADQEEWTSEQIVEHIKSGYKGTTPDDPAREIVQRTVLHKIARSKELDSLDISKIYRELKADSKTPIQKFEKFVKDLQKGPVQGISQTELAEATIVELQKTYSNLAFYLDQIYVWNGTNWEPIEEQEVREIISTVFGHLPHALNHPDHVNIVKVMKDLLPQEIKGAVDVHGINFANGFLNEELKLVPHAPEQGMIYTLPYHYKQELAGKMPLFEAYLQSVWGKDPDYQAKRVMLQEAMAVTLFGTAVPYQRAFLLFGEPSSGKSVLRSIVECMVPFEAQSACSPSEWDNNNHKFATAQMAGMLLNVCGELDRDERIKSTIFKQVVEGALMTAQWKHGQIFKTRFLCAHWFCSNYLPKSDDHTSAFTRRWMVFKFNQSIAAKDIILDLDKKIVSEEIEAIIAWALQAYPALVKNGRFTLAPSSEEECELMAQGNSSVRYWYKRCIGHKPGAKLTEKNLHDNYWNYTSVHLQGKSVAVKRFNEEMTAIITKEGLPAPHIEGNTIYYTDLVIL